jgi:hypothetical protein
MEPDRFEWLHQEQARVARGGTGRQFVQNQLRQNFLRGAGINLVILPVILIAAKLPRQLNGPVEPLPLLVLGLSTLAIGAGALWAGAGRHRVGWWAAWTAIGLGVFLAVGSALV